jgi:hypothetical protein
VAPAAQQDLARPGAQVVNCHLGSVEATSLRHHREKDGVAAWQDLRPDVIAFVLRVVGTSQNLWRPTFGGHPLQPGRRAGRREDDRAIGRPCGAAGSAVNGCERDRRATPDSNLHQYVAAAEETDRLTVRRDEWSSQGAAICDGHRLKRVERADEELRAVITDVDDVHPVG